MHTFSRRGFVVSACTLVVPLRPALAQETGERAAGRLIADLVNAGRARLQPELPPLIREPALDEIAGERSRDMAAGAPFDHQDAQGGYPAIEKMRARYSKFGAMGENIGMDYRYERDRFDPQAFAGRMVKGWFDSEGHRDNILSPFFTHCGVGVALSPGGRTTIYATQVFWGPPKRR